MENLLTNLTVLTIVLNAIPSSVTNQWARLLPNRTSPPAHRSKDAQPHSASADDRQAGKPAVKNHVHNPKDAKPDGKSKGVDTGQKRTGGDSDRKPKGAEASRKRTDARHPQESMGANSTSESAGEESPAESPDQTPSRDSADDQAPMPTGYARTPVVSIFDLVRDFQGMRQFGCLVRGSSDLLYWLRTLVRVILLL
jgi:hypothetical protein